MRTHTNPARCATAAIAAALALGSTPLLAQAVSPTGEPIIIPPVVTAPQAAAPAAAAPTMQSSPTVQNLPSDYVPAKAAAPASPVTTTASPATNTPRAAAPATRNTPRAAAPVAAQAPAPVAANDTAAPVEAAPLPATTGTELFPASDNAVEPAAAPIEENTASGTLNGIAIVASLVGIMVLMAIGLFALFSTRRRRALREAPPQVVRPTVPQPVAHEAQPVAEPKEELAPAVTRAETSFAPTVRATPQVEPASTAFPAAGYGAAPAVTATPAFTPSEPSPIRKPASQVKGALASNGASVDLPAEIPASYEDRDALLKRMIEAKPDKANPFTDRKARMKRARLIIQSLGVSFADRDPWIDLSQYPNNWPELARRRYSQAA